MNQNSFATAVLKKLGIPVTPGALQAMVGWQNAEGGHWHNKATYNPLNTTQPEPGAGNTGTQGNIKQYTSWSQGVAATVQTLKNGNYGGILRALKAGSPSAVAHAISNSPWGTSGGLVARTIANAPSSLHGAGGALGASSSAPSAAPSYRTIPGTSHADERAGVRSLQGQSVRDFLAPQGQPTDILDFALQQKSYRDQLAGLRDTPSQRVPVAGTTAGGTATTGTASSSSFAKSHSPLLEEIYNYGSGYAVKNGQVVSGPQVYGAVWSGHRDHVHVAAGPKTVVALGKIAQGMGLHVGENSHFGGVSPVHVAGSYHYKDEAIDVSGNPKRMASFAKEVQRLYRLTPK